MELSLLLLKKIINPLKIKQMIKPESNTKRFFTGLWIGAAVGVIVTLLFTTEKGKVIRKKITSSTSDLTEDLPNKIEALKKAIEEKVHEMKDKNKNNKS